MQIYIHRNNEDFGPYSREAVLEYVRQGAFEAQDFACYAGMADWKTLGDLLGIREGFEMPEVPRIHEFSPVTASGRMRITGPLDLPPPPPMRRKKSRETVEKQLRFMIGLNAVLILIIAIGIFLRLPGPSRYFEALAAILHHGPAVVAQAAAAPTPAPAASAPAVDTVEAAKAASPAAVAAVAASAAPTPAPAASAPVVAAAESPVPVPLESPSPAAAPAASAPAIAAAESPAPAATPAAMDSPAPAASAPPAETPPPTPPPPPKPFDPSDIAANRAAWPKTLRLKQAVLFPAVFNGQVVGNVTVPAGAVVKLAGIEGDQLVLDFNGGRQRLSWKLTDLDQEAAKIAPAAPPAAPAAAAPPPPAAPAATAAPAGAPDASGVPPSDN